MLVPDVGVPCPSAIRSKKAIPTTKSYARPQNRPRRAFGAAWRRLPVDRPPAGGVGSVGSAGRVGSVVELSGAFGAPEGGAGLTRARRRALVWAEVGSGESFGGHHLRCGGWLTRKVPRGPPVPVSDGVGQRGQATLDGTIDG